MPDATIVLACVQQQRRRKRHNVSSMDQWSDFPWVAKIPNISDLADAMNLLGAEQLTRLAGLDPNIGY